MTSIYEEIVENLPVLICRFLPGDGKITLVNKAYCDYFGKSRDELIGKSFLELIPQEDHEQVKRHYKSLSKDNPIITYEHPVFTPGGRRWQRWTDKALIDEKGNIVYVQLRDVEWKKGLKSYFSRLKRSSFSSAHNSPPMSSLEELN